MVLPQLIFMDRALGKIRSGPMTGKSENPATVNKNSISKGVAARARQILFMFVSMTLNLSLWSDHS